MKQRYAGLQRLHLIISLFVLGLAVWFGLGPLAVGAQPTIYRTDSGTADIVRYSSDGSMREVLVGGPIASPVGIALDVKAGTMYWADQASRKIQRANLDGTNIEDLVTGLAGPKGLALDLDAGKIYWTDLSADMIQRANLDGTNIENLVTGLDGPTDIALDPEAGKMYWTDSWNDRIQRANLDGTNVQDLVTGLGNLGGIALDIPNGKMYWTDWWDDKIQRANLDGTNVEDLVTAGFVRPVGLALDLEAGKMYWTDWQAQKIQRANMDGTNVEDVITGVPYPEGIALDLKAGTMYWTDWGLRKIQRANLDGSGTEDLIGAELRGPTGLALDLKAGKMYWTDVGIRWVRLSEPADDKPDLFSSFPSERLSVGAKVAIDAVPKIQRANLDGSGVEDLITTGLGVPGGLALDLDAGKMYWADRGTQKIQRANLDGSNVEDLINTGSTSAPVGLVLDVAAGKMYWADWRAETIQRANLNGTGVEDLVTTGLSIPNAIALDVGASKMYWTDYGTDKIQRANLDGSDIEDLVTGLIRPAGLALDPTAGTMYWADWGPGTIQRANLDGTNVEDLVSGLVYPEDIALDVTRELPVELTHFTAAASGEAVTLRWATASEISNAGFDIERRINDGAFAPIGFVEGAGTTAEPKSYRFVDNSLPFGAKQLNYRLKQIDVDGAFNYSAEVEVMLSAPAALALHPPYPNPMQNSATIRYELPQPGAVRLMLYNALGQRVATLVDRAEAGGWHEMTFDGSRLASGLYLIRLQSPASSVTRKLTVVR